MLGQTSFFADSGLPPALGYNLRRFNPWWEGEAMPLQPKTRRHLVAQMRRRLDANIAPIIVVRGPRQIGKTTAQFQIIQDLLDEGVDPKRILRVQFDDLPRDDLGAVEVYRREVETPMEFMRTGSTCGAIVVWTPSGAGFLDWAGDLPDPFE